MIIHGLSRTNNPDPPAEADRLGAAWFDCLHTNAKQIAGNAKPTKADAEAAVPRCSTEENAFREFSDWIKNDPRSNASSDPDDKIPIDVGIAELRKAFVWEIYSPHMVTRK